MILLTEIDVSGFVKTRFTPMANIKISSKVDASAWAALQQLVDESHQSISGLLTEAVEDYVRQRIGLDVLRHLEDSIERNEALGRRLAR